MEGTVDPSEVGQAVATHVDPGSAAIPSPAAASIEPQEGPVRPRQFDDIPSVVRALLTGYDEV